MKQYHRLIIPDVVGSVYYCSSVYLGDIHFARVLGSVESGLLSFTAKHLYL